MLYITVPFEHRDHTGSWLLIAEDGWAIQPKDGKLVAVQPLDAKPLGTMDLNVMVEAHKMEYDVCAVCASPFPKR